MDNLVEIILTNQHFECSVCLGPMIDARIVVPCGHSFCHMCAGRFNRCPMCRTDVQTIIQNIVLIQCVRDAILMKCKGCSDVFGHDDLDKHARKCKQLQTIVMSGGTHCDPCTDRAAMAEALRRTGADPSEVARAAVARAAHAERLGPLPRPSASPATAAAASARSVPPTMPPFNVNAINESARRAAVSAAEARATASAARHVSAAAQFAQQMPTPEEVYRTYHAGFVMVETHEATAAHAAASGRTDTGRTGRHTAHTRQRIPLGDWLLYQARRAAGYPEAFEQN